MKNKINQKENQIVFWLNSKTYPLEAIYSTAYTLLDKVYVYLDGDPKKEIIVSLKGKEKLNKKQIEALKGNFCNELLSYVLRVEIAKRNQKIRDFIVGTALISALPTPLEIKKSNDKKKDTLNDSLNIAVPWEEKYGNKIEVKKAKTKNKKKKCK